jgi:hypothetical protein
MRMIQTPRMANMQNRYDRLSADPTLRPMQQRTMERLGGKLGINPQTAVTGGGPNVSTTPIPLSRTPPPMATDSIPVGPGVGAMGGGIGGGMGGGARPTVSGGPAPNYGSANTDLGRIPGTGPSSGPTGGGMSPAGMAGSAGKPAGMNMGTMKKGGKVKQMASGGMTSKVSSASKRGDGIAQRGKTKGRMI